MEPLAVVLDFSWDICAGDVEQGGRGPVAAGAPGIRLVAAREDRTQGLAAEPAVFCHHRIADLRNRVVSISPRDWLGHCQTGQLLVPAGRSRLGGVVLPV